MSQYDKAWGKHRYDAEFCKHDLLVSNYDLPATDTCLTCDWCPSCEALRGNGPHISVYDGDTCTECLRLWGYDYHPDDCRECHGETPPPLALIHHYTPEED